MTFEQVNGEVVLTGDSAIPLIRYAVGDNGGVLSYNDMLKICKKHNVSIDDFISSSKNVANHKYPFVYVYERINFSASLHGINIYPEFVKDGLSGRELSEHITEKFTMITKLDKNLDQYLEVNLELKKGTAPSPKIIALAKKEIKSSLFKKSSEFVEISKSKSSSNLIQCILWPSEHPKYFAPGVSKNGL